MTRSEPCDVLLLCWRDTEHPQGGGSERYLERVGAELAARGMRVTLLTAGYAGAPAVAERDGIRILRAGGRLGVYPRALATLMAARFGRGRLAGARPKVVVDTQNGVPFFATVAGLAPTVVLVHHCHREQWPVAGRLLARVGWLIESRISPWVHRRNRYITVSEPSAVELVELGVDRERISVVRNGIDPLPEYAGAPQVTDPVVRLCVLSRLVPHKQVEDALAALAELRRDGIEARLDVIGGGWWDAELRAEAARLGIAGAVDFHGHVDEAEKHRLLARARVHLMPSRKEGWGLAVIEAAQHGVPTVGYRSSAGLTDSIVHGETGLLVDDRAELVAATRKLLDNPEETARLGRNACDRAGTYSWPVTADGFEAVFARLGRRGR